MHERYPRDARRGDPAWNTLRFDEADQKAALRRGHIP